MRRGAGEVIRVERPPILAYGRGSRQRETVGRQPLAYKDELAKLFG